MKRFGRIRHNFTHLISTRIFMTTAYSIHIDHTPIQEIISPAVFIADAHYIPSPTHTCTQAFGQALEPSSARLDSNFSFLDSSLPYPRYIGEDGLMGLLQALMGNPPAQIFLMGDIAHLFIPHISHSADNHRDFIALLNALSQHTEIFYFEGNHDFGIDSRLLPRVRIYPRSLQPAIFSYQNTPFLLAHGDLFINKSYECYIRALSAPLTLSALKLLDTLSLGYIYTYAQSLVNAKRIAPLHLDESGFYTFALKRLAAYTHYMRANNLARACSLAKPSDTDPQGTAKQAKDYELNAQYGVIEGHFHIGRRLQSFFALPSFYCEKRILVL